MKKIIAVLAIIFSLATSATYAYDGSDANRTLLRSFNKVFAGASNVSLAQVSDELYRFSFAYNGKNAQAFFTESGDLVATGSVISGDHLPLTVAKAIDSKYAGYDKIESFEFTMDGETKYLVTVADGKKKEIVKVSISGEIDVFRTIKY